MEVSGQLHLQVFLLSIVFIHKMMGLYQKWLLRGIRDMTVRERMS